MGVLKVGFLELRARLGLVEQQFVDEAARQVLRVQGAMAHVDEGDVGFGYGYDDLTGFQRIGVDFTDQREMANFSANPLTRRDGLPE
jgi:hypothetical protein